MTVYEERVVTVAVLREILGLPASRPDGVCDLLVVPRERGEPVPDVMLHPWWLALGDWPELWRASPETGPQYLVMLRGLTPPYLIATVEVIDPTGWGAGEDAEPGLRLVPTCGTAAATAGLAGCRLDSDVAFGWVRPEDQYAFL
jgi:hypothetical protein